MSFSPQLAYAISPNLLTLLAQKAQFPASNASDGQMAPDCMCDSAHAVSPQKRWMSKQRKRWADGPFLWVNCVSKASSLSAGGASLADVRAPRSGARTFS